MQIKLYSVLVGNVYTLTADVTGAVGAVVVTWVPNVTNRPTKQGMSITRSFSTTASQWSETATAVDSTGAKVSATIFLDLVTDSPPPPPNTPAPISVTIDAVLESALLAVPVGDQVDLIGPNYITTITRV
jgi:hypothetical protein